MGGQRGPDLDPYFPSTCVQWPDPVPVDFHGDRSLEKANGDGDALLLANFNEKTFETRQGTFL
ncbi:MAG TPA: hypothetical protein VMH80_27410 [Bryobacteraceae bacterium]|nr:hypothetical protein [Bryobacteraceae bacterium]